MQCPPDEFGRKSIALCPVNSEMAFVWTWAGFCRGHGGVPGRGCMLSETGGRWVLAGNGAEAVFLIEGSAELISAAERVSTA